MLVSDTFSRLFFKYRLDKREFEALRDLIVSLKDVYRFIGSKHEVIRPNSVLDHVVGLESLILGIFTTCPYDLIGSTSELRDTLLTYAYLHDAGECFGELSVLDSVLDKNSKPCFDKEELEYIFFTTAIDWFKKDPFYDIRDHRQMVHISKAEGTSKYYSCMKPSYISPSLDTLYKASTTDNNPEFKLFKLLDLVEGCEYYINNASDPSRVPEEHKTRYLSYYIDQVRKLINYDVDADVYNYVKSRIIDKAVTTQVRYMNLMGL